jgi:hypothetical protein
VFYGYTFLPIPNSDGSRYKYNFENTNTYSFTQYLGDIEDVFQGEADNPDFYAPTLKFIVHSFTNNASIYFLVAALVYFFIFLKLIETIWNMVVKKNAKYYIGFFIGCFFIYNLSAGINSIRFPLAFIVFTFGTLNLMLKGNRKYLMIALLSVLIHFSFIFPFLFLLISYIMKFKENGWVLYLSLLFVVFFSSVFPTFLAENISFFGKVSESKLEAYTQEGFVETRVNHLQVWNWYVYLNFYSTYFFSIAALFLTKLKFSKIKFDATSQKLYFFGVIMLIHALLSGSIVDTLTNRFILLFSIFVLIYLFYLSSINHGNRLLSVLNYIYVPILILNILIKLRADMDTVNIIILIGNWFIAIFSNF